MMASQSILTIPLEEERKDIQFQHVLPIKLCNLIFLGIFEFLCVLPRYFIISVFLVLK
jgi:hypothetical protein